MDLYGRIADLPLVVEGSGRVRRERDTSSGFRRATTTFVLQGNGAVGRGEDVTYDAIDHDALAAAPSFDLAGEYTFEEFSRALDDVELFPTKPPDREAARHYRQWGLESAGLDLALRQAGESLASAFDREYDPVRFVVSTRLGDPPTADRLESLLETYPGTEFKLDPTSAWSEDLIAAVASTDTVRVLDLKGQYHGTVVDQGADADLYRRVLDGFPEAVIEDPALSEATEDLVAEHRDRISWDAPITDVESIEALPFEPNWLNVKPSRFGTVESVLAAIEYCDARGISMYGGGQFELDVGRSHVQLLASLFYPDGPNDVAPGGYNDPDPPSGLARSPLSPPAEPAGLEW